MQSEWNDTSNPAGNAQHLMIVGNGFDLHHGLETKYENYEEWLKENDFRLYKQFKDFEYLNSKDDPNLWSELENSLGIDWDGLCEDVLSSTYPNLGDDHPGWDDFWIELKLRLHFLRMITRDRFREWIGSIDVCRAKPCVRLPEDALFVTFNYTLTLESVYGIPRDSILHLHGSLADDCDSLLQFGSPQNRPDGVVDILERKYGMDDLYGASIQQGASVAADQCAYTWKNIDANCPLLKEFLKQSPKIKTVIIMGNTYDGVDEPYYCNVLAPLFRNAEWVFCEYEPNHMCQMRIDRFCNRLGIANHRMTGYEEFDLS